MKSTKEPKDDITTMSEEQWREWQRQRREVDRMRKEQEKRESKLEKDMLERFRKAMAKKNKQLGLKD